MERCDECGYAYGALARDELASSIRSLAPRYRTLLDAADDAALRAHPLPGVWSALEYTCHLRDVLRVQRERIGLALTEEQPTFSSMRREERVTEERYNKQPVERIARELAEAADALADALDELDEDDWRRTGVYNWPRTEPRTIEWIARHTMHEGEHHLMDVERLIATAND